ncbi:MAG: glycosyl hydrolase, partial [Phycisphaerae bacterium]
MRKNSLVLKVLFISICLLPINQAVCSIGQEKYVENTPSDGSFRLAEKEHLADILADSQDYKGVLRAADDLKEDINRVAKNTPKLLNDKADVGEDVIIIGTIGKSRFIDELVRNGKVDVSPISGKWESFIIQVVPEPMEGIKSGLVIVGSDKRGTIYGIYDVSQQI